MVWVPVLRRPNEFFDITIGSMPPSKYCASSISLIEQMEHTNGLIA